MKIRGRSKIAQVTLFIILAIVILAAIGAYFILRSRIGPTPETKDMQPVYDYYLSCLEGTTKAGILIMGEQGGYIEKPVFVPGSEYRPFSSQLNFMGQGVPYWMYVSGNNLLKEQVPSKAGMEKELAKYVQDRIKECNFDSFAFQGYDIAVGEGNVEAKINENYVSISADNRIRVSFENQSQVFSNPELSVQSKLGKFYRLALKFYEKEKKEMILEKYALDVMRLYAPVDGVEISCTPKVFVEENVKQDLKEALQANIGALKLRGNYFASTKENKYFVNDIGESVSDGVNFIYSPNWPTRIDMNGDKVIEPVGLQQGLGILGFCYVPYHFVYDINFPVLVQFYDENELFQFPVGVIIEKNKERQALPSAEGQAMEEDVCAVKDKDVEVYTYDSELNPVKANIKFSCFSTECRIGETEIEGADAVLRGKVPACVNAFILASAEGYADSRYQISTNEETTANILMKKLYNISVELNGGQDVGMAIISLEGEYSTSIVYPDTKSIMIPEGEYNVSVYIYTNQKLTIPAISSEKCINVPKSGVAGIFGFEEEKCFQINLPPQEVETAVVGGGKSQEYFAESDLNKKLLIQAEIFKTPESLAELQENYIKIDDSPLEVMFE